MSADELEILLDVEQSPPTSQSPLPGGTSRNSGWSWVAWILLAGVLLWQFRGCAGDLLPVTDDKIAMEGPALLIAADGEKMDRLTDGQAAACNSQKVQSWCEDNDVAFRRYDVRDDLSKEDKLWQDMMKAAKDGTVPNWVAVDKSGRGSVVDPPASVNEAISFLERRFK